MISRIVKLLVVLGLVVGLAGCDPTPTPTPVPTPAPQSLVVPVAAAAQTQPTAVPPTAGPTDTPVVVQVVVTATPEPEGPQGPELLAPPDGLEAMLFDLMWEWEAGLQPDEWYELQIWPDEPDAEPSVFTWLKEDIRRITAANLLPGRYRWRVVVVEGYDETRGEETSPYSEERTFIMVRPSTLASLDIEIPIIPTRTPTPKTYYIVVTATPTRSATIPAPTATVTSTLPTPTSTTAAPTATATTAPPTATPTSGATVVVPTVAPQTPTTYP